VRRGPLGPAFAAALCAAVTAYLSVRFLMKYFETRTLVPFAVYCLVAGVASALYLTLS
jgi:undecaprenyl-diphosphatase